MFARGTLFMEPVSAKPQLVVVTLLDPPYPEDTVATGSGWLPLDVVRIRQSETWNMARPEIRPWLLMLWMVAWEQAPCATLPPDENQIQALLGIDAGLFAAHRSVLLAHWEKRSDGRLYHWVLTEHVLRMLAVRAGNRVRQARHRETAADREAKRATRLPLDWRVPEEWLAWAEEIHGVDRKRGTRISLAFRDYWVSKSGAAACKLDWAATWRNWIRKEVGEM